jgi:DNA-binding MarR family transcriptional regulator
MKTIQELIKASSFESSGHKAYVNLLYTYYFFYNLHSSLLKDFDLLPQHYNILRIIKGKHPEPVSSSHILDVMLDKKRDITRLVDKLEKIEYVKRIKNKDNKRIIDITLTSKGMDAFLKMEKIGLGLYNNLDETESEIISNLLDKMRDLGSRKG